MEKTMYSFSVRHQEEIDLVRIVKENTNQEPVIIIRTSTTLIVGCKFSWLENFRLSDNVMLMGISLYKHWGEPGIVYSADSERWENCGVLIPGWRWKCMSSTNNLHLLDVVKQLNQCIQRLKKRTKIEVHFPLKRKNSQC